MLEATIYDLNGQMLMKQNVKNKLNVGTLKNGVCFLKLTNEFHETINKIIIKK
jgi:hypothetical protein